MNDKLDQKRDSQKKERFDWRYFNCGTANRFKFLLKINNHILLSNIRVFWQKGEHPAAIVQMSPWNPEVNMRVCVCMWTKTNHTTSENESMRRNHPSNVPLHHNIPVCMGIWTPRKKAVINIMAVWLHGMSDPWNISEREQSHWPHVF